MGFWEQFAISQGLASLHTIIRKYGAKYFTQDELAAFDIAIDALGELPQRVHDGNVVAVQPSKRK